jgi:hypothetical protein
MVKIVKSMAILDNAHPIMGVAVSKLVGVVEKISPTLRLQTVKHPPPYRILDTPL